MPNEGILYYPSNNNPKTEFMKTLIQIICLTTKGNKSQQKIKITKKETNPKVQNKAYKIEKCHFRP